MSDANSNDRRRFLKTSVAVGAGAAASALLPRTAAAVAEEKSDPKTDDPRGYRLTPHILSYYKSAKL